MMPQASRSHMVLKASVKVAQLVLLPSFGCRGTHAPAGQAHKGMQGILSRYHT
jgi:hypothetical protein